MYTFFLFFSIRRSNSFGYKSNRDQKTPGVSKLPRRLPTRRFSSADDKMSTKATNLSENTGPPQVKPKRKKSKYTDPFENKAITLARF